MPNLNYRIRLRDKGICIYCKDSVGQHIDHVIPRKHKGPTISANLVLSCIKCNLIKKGEMHETMIQIAFAHLKSVGENLSWIESSFIGVVDLLHIAATDKKRLRKIFEFPNRFKAFLKHGKHRSGSLSSLLPEHFYKPNEQFRRPVPERVVTPPETPMRANGKRRIKTYLKSKIRKGHYHPNTYTRYRRTHKRSQ